MSSIGVRAVPYEKGTVEVRDARYIRVVRVIRAFRMFWAIGGV